MVFRDRTDAGRQLGVRLGRLQGEDVVVLGLARGGVPVAFEVSKALDAPLDVIIVRKLGVPFQPEFAMGAIGEGGVRILNDEVLHRSRVEPSALATVETREREVVEKRATRLRQGHPRRSLIGKTAIIVDDGIATGSTARAACQVARANGATRVILAVPIASREVIAELSSEVDEVVCLDSPEPFFAVGQGYSDFSQTSDEQVIDLLDRAATRDREVLVTKDPIGDPLVRDEEVVVRCNGVELAGHLTVPEVPIGFVIFVHGSDSGRLSLRNRLVASILNASGLGTLLFDLLTPDEELNRANVFDIALLGERLECVTRWLAGEPESKGVRIGYFGASTGAAAALSAAAKPDSNICAVVSRGGRPDLAGPELAGVQCPTLLIVGGDDDVVIELNREAQTELRCLNELIIVPGATHLFEEPGALDMVAELATDWFTHYLETE